MLNSWLDDNIQKVVEIRRWLHQHPEVGFNEHETSKYCQKLMQEMGFESTRPNPCKQDFTVITGMEAVKPLQSAAIWMPCRFMR